MKFFILFAYLFISLSTMAQKTDTVWLRKLLESKPALFSNILNHPEENQVQILYTQIDRDDSNIPHFKSFGFNIDSRHYFYPASTVKLAAVIFALEKVNQLKRPGLTAESRMLTDSNFKGQTKVFKDKTAKNGYPTIAHYIKKILLTSDNDAYNRLFEFIGRAEINQKLKDNGLNGSRILNRLAVGDGAETAKHSNPIRFYNGDRLIYSQPAQYDQREYPLPLTHTVMGKGYLDSMDRLVDKPFSLADKNAFPIIDQQRLMQKLIFPECFASNERFRLTNDDYNLIYTYMSKYPTESLYPKYNQDEFWPVYGKMLFYGSDKNAKIEQNIRIFNKYGDSYGYIIDNSFFVDFENGVEFLLTAVVQSNEDGIYNDDKYEYETVCYPFMKNLGKSIYEYELTRKKRNKPDLTKYKMDYAK